MRECFCLFSTDPFLYDQNSSLFCQYACGEILLDMLGTSISSSLVSPGSAGKHQFWHLEHLCSPCHQPWCVPGYLSHLVPFTPLCPCSILPFLKNAFPEVPPAWLKGSTLACGRSLLELGVSSTGQPGPLLTEATLQHLPPAPGHRHPVQPLDICPPSLLSFSCSPSPAPSLISVHRHGGAT